MVYSEDGILTCMGTQFTDVQREKHKYRTLSAAYNRLTRDHTQLEWDYIVLKQNFELIKMIRIDELVKLIDKNDNRIHW